MLRSNTKGVTLNRAIPARIAAGIAAVLLITAILTASVAQPASGRAVQASRSVAVRAAAPKYVAVTVAPEYSSPGKVIDTAAIDAAVLSVMHKFHLAHEAHLAHIAHKARLVELAQRQEAAVSEPAAPAHTASIGAVPSSSYVIGSAFQRCVINAESGGNAQIWNASGHYGLYQFSYSTWVAHGGDPSLFGHASAAYQTKIFWNTVAVDGTSDWSPYDGC